MLITCKDFIFSDFTWKKIFASGNDGEGEGLASPSCPPLPYEPALETHTIHLPLNSTSQAREILIGADFKRYEDTMIFWVFIFIFCWEPTVREQLNKNDFCHYYGNFFESTVLKLLDHSYVHIHSNYEALWQQHWKTPCSWRFYGHGST